MAMAPGKQGGETTEVPAKNTRDFENPLRSMLTISRMTVNNDKLLQVDNHSTTNDENGSDNRHDNNLAPNSHTVDSNPIPQLPVLEEGEGQNRSCLDATLSRLVKALVSACLASASLTNPAQTPDTSRPPSVEEVAGTVVTPLMLQSSKGAGTEECRDSARALLRFFGHSPLLHVEGVIWFKMSGKKVPCIAALSSWSLFMVPLRAPWSVGGFIADFRSKQHSAAKIIEVPLSSMLEVGVVSARENLNTFASDEANNWSRPFRIITESAVTSSEKDPLIQDLFTSSSPVDGEKDSGNSNFIGKAEPVLTLIGFEVVSRLRHFLVVARESWAIRSTVTSGGSIAQVLTSSRGAAKRYIAGIHEATSGQLRNQNNAQIEIMVDLANELLLDRAVKQTFFSTGNIFFEITRWLEQEGEEDIVSENSGDALRLLVKDMRWFSAAAAVLNSAFFHSIEVPERIDLVARPIPVSIPRVSELLVDVYFSLRRRLAQFGHDNRGCAEEEKCNNISSHGLTPAGFGGRNGGSGGDEGRVGMAAKTANTDDLEKLSTSMGDWLVGALNGMGEAVRLFNLENERKGLVRNLVSVTIGQYYRSRSQPAASDASGLLMTLTERTAGLIEHLNRVEQTRLQELEILRRQREKDSPPATPKPPFRKVDRKRGKRSSFFGLRPLSPATSVTPPGSPSEPPAAQSTVGHNGPPKQRLAFHADRGLRSASSMGHTLTKEGSLQKVDLPQPKNCVNSLSGNDTGGFGTNSHHGELDNSNEDETQRQKGLRRDGTASLLSAPTSMPRALLLNTPVLLYSYSKLLHALVCGSYDLRAAFVVKCEAELRNIGRDGGYLDLLAMLDGGAPRMVFRESARFLHEICIECEM